MRDRERLASWYCPATSAANHRVDGFRKSQQDFPPWALGKRKAQIPDGVVQTEIYSRGHRRATRCGGSTLAKVPAWKEQGKRESGQGGKMPGLFGGGGMDAA